MAKRKDDFSFGFSSKKPAPKKPAKSDDNAPAETPADPFASSDSPAADPFASAESPAADPFASTETPAADPFASADAPATDPFASADAPAADPFASAETPAADPFAATEAPAESPAETTASEAPTETTANDASPTPKQPKQFRVLIMGDFSGRANRNISEPASIGSRKIQTVDADSLEKVLARIKPEIQLPVNEKSIVSLSFKAMDDFKPDALLENIEAFQGLLKLRADLKDNKKFKETAAKVRKLTGTAPAKKPAKAAGKDASGDSEFERLLNQPIAPKNAGEVDTDAFIANLVAGYSVPDADPEQAKLVALIEDALSAGLRAVLRHPAFQAVEGAWRSVEFLTSRLNTDDELKLCLLDISKDEIYADLSAPVLQKTGLYQLLIEQTRVPGAFPFSLVVGDFEFEQTPQNIALLAKLATLAHEANVPFVAGASAKITGFASYVQFAQSAASTKWQPPADIAMWDKIRGHKLANHIALAGPRFLLRLPYGPKTDAIDTYPFTEISDANAPKTEFYLWGNGAFAIAHACASGLLNNGFSDTGIEPELDLTDLPCHMAMVDGDKEMTPCAQAWISDRVADIMHSLGIVPLLSVKNAPSAKIAGIHSIAKAAGGGKPLAASWAGA